MNRITRILSLVAASAMLATLPSLAMSQSIERLSVSPDSVTGGQSATGSVTLRSKAPSGGISITLASNQTFAQVPASVTVASGSRSATFTITTSAVTARSSATITGTDPNNKTESESLRVVPSFLEKIALSPESVVGGSPSTATLTLSGAAPTGGLAITVLSNLADAQVPSSVTVPAGTSTATFNITTSAVTKTSNAVILATDANGRHAIAELKITAPIVVDIRSLGLDAARVVGGGTATGIDEWNSEAPTGGLLITLASSETFAQVPANVTVAAGSKKATFTITTTDVTTSGTATITGTDPNSKTAKATLDVVPFRLVGVAVSPAVIKGGDTATGIVLLNAAAPTGGIVITLASNQTSLQVPASVTIPAGSLSASFPVTTTAPATSRERVTITAADPNGKTVKTEVDVRS